MLKKTSDIENELASVNIIPVYVLVNFIIWSNVQMYNSQLSPTKKSYANNISIIIKSNK